MVKWQWGREGEIKGMGVGSWPRGYESGLIWRSGWWGLRRGRQPMRFGQQKQGRQEVATLGGVRCVRVSEGKRYGHVGGECRKWVHHPFHASQHISLENHFYGSTHTTITALYHIKRGCPWQLKPPLPLPLTPITPAGLPVPSLICNACGLRLHASIHLSPFHLVVFVFTPFYQTVPTSVIYVCMQVYVSPP